MLSTRLPSLHRLAAATTHCRGSAAVLACLLLRSWGGSTPSASHISLVAPSRASSQQAAALHPVASSTCPEASSISKTLDEAAVSIQNAEKLIQGRSSPLLLPLLFKAVDALEGAKAQVLASGATDLRLRCHALMLQTCHLVSKLLLLSPSVASPLRASPLSACPPNTVDVVDVRVDGPESIKEQADVAEMLGLLMKLVGFPPLSSPLHSSIGATDLADAPIPDKLPACLPYDVQTWHRALALLSHPSSNSPTPLPSPLLSTLHFYVSSLLSHGFTPSAHTLTILFRAALGNRDLDATYGLLAFAAAKGLKISDALSSTAMQVTDEHTTQVRREARINSGYTGRKIRIRRLTRPKQRQNGSNFPDTSVLEHTDIASPYRSNTADKHTDPEDAAVVRVGSHVLGLQANTIKQLQYKLLAHHNNKALETGAMEAGILQHDASLQRGNVTIRMKLDRVPGFIGISTLNTPDYPKEDDFTAASPAASSTQSSPVPIRARPSWPLPRADRWRRSPPKVLPNRRRFPSGAALGSQSTDNMMDTSSGSDSEGEWESGEGGAAPVAAEGSSDVSEEDSGDSGSDGEDEDVVVEMSREDEAAIERLTQEAQQVRRMLITSISEMTNDPLAIAAASTATIQDQAALVDVAKAGAAQRSLNGSQRLARRRQMRARQPYPPRHNPSVSPSDAPAHFPETSDLPPAVSGLLPAAGGSLLPQWMAQYLIHEDVRRVALSSLLSADLTAVTAAVEKLHLAPEEADAVIQAARLRLEHAARNLPLAVPTSVGQSSPLLSSPHLSPHLSQHMIDVAILEAKQRWNSSTWPSEVPFPHLHPRWTPEQRRGEEGRGEGKAGKASPLPSHVVSALVASLLTSRSTLMTLFSSSS